MTGLRDLAATALDAVGVPRAALALAPPPAGAVTILAYHRVLDVPDEERFPFDVELVSASREAFRRQVAHVARHFTPITFAALQAALDRGEAPPRRALIVTFDDGFIDNYRVAFPVLREFGVPATIFVSTGYVDRQEHYWYERVAHAVLTARAPRLGLPGGASVELGTGYGARRPALKRLLGELKRLEDDARRREIPRLVAELDPASPCEGDDRSGPMTWAQVKEMSDAGIEFGSHGVDHPVLARASDEVLERELVQSRARLEAQTGKPVHALAYPVGGPGAFDARVVAAAKAAGYRFGVSYVAGVDNVGTWDPFAIRRLHVERYTGDARFRAMLALPRHFA